MRYLTGNRLMIGTSVAVLLAALLAGSSRSVAGPLSMARQLAGATVAKANRAATAGIGPAVYTVSYDVAGAYRTVQAAVNAVPVQNKQPVIIRIDPGSYPGQVVIPADKAHITLQGTSARNTELTDDLPVRDAGKNGHPRGFMNTATLCIYGPYTTLDNLTVENSYVQKSNTNGNQALALTIGGDKLVVNHCRILGFQDTIYFSHPDPRAYFSHCLITGAVDYIYGFGTGLFDHCTIRNVNKGHWGSITAPSTPENQNFGFVFRHCRLTGLKSTPAGSVYLGRPWRPYGSTTFIDCYMGKQIRPVGWSNWKNPKLEKTARFAEYHSTGPGASVKSRAKWSKQLTSAQAAKITAARVLGSGNWWKMKP
ncbi:MAG: pectinesterase family protein [Phycisphaerae bacterium]